MRLDELQFSIHTSERWETAEPVPNVIVFRAREDVYGAGVKYPKGWYAIYDQRESPPTDYFDLEPLAAQAILIELLGAAYAPR